MSDLIVPLFVVEGKDRRDEVIPGIYRRSIDLALKEVEVLASMGILGIDLFATIPQEKKTVDGRQAFNEKGLLYQATKEIKRHFPDMCVAVDIALDPFTSHGHDGLINDKGEVINDKTVEMLGRMSLMAADAGADIVAPSDMMDGRVGHIRRALDAKGFHDVSILSYAVKYASHFYGPFREIVGSKLKGHKKTYQMDPANWKEAIREALLDEEEGADFLLIKPALLYLDVIAKIKEKTLLPIGGYHVSGEYAMVMAAEEKGWVDAKEAFFESLLAIKRAGADFIITYAAHAIKDRISSHHRSY